MDAVLHIDCSARVEESVSRRLSRAVVDQLFRSERVGKLIRRDLGAAAPPPVNQVEAAAFFTPPPARTDEQTRALAASDELTDELLTAATVVIGSPMYNFTAPASLKAWIDYVVRPGKTFRRTDSGEFEGLCGDKRVYVCTASSGAFRGTGMDCLRPYLEVIFGFIGISGLVFFDAEGLAQGGQERELAIDQALANIQRHFLR